MSLRGSALDVVVYLAVIAHMLAAPYTKVEESFNVQACHDAMLLGASPSALGGWDHVQFPGAVPRTFVGALLSSAIGAPAAALAWSRGAPLIAGQLCARGALAAISVGAFALFRHATRDALGGGVGRALALVVLVQFHLPFYMSRFLPNTFALAVAHIATGLALRERPYAALSTIAAGAALFRCDLVLLLAPVGIWLWLFRPPGKRASFARAAACAAGAAAAAAALSVAVDSILWQRTLWPELEVLLFNTVDNRSSEWGTSPPSWYLYSALPRALLGAMPLALAGFVLEPRVRAPVLCSATFIALYSALPHKETRFLYPALPAFNLAAAVAVDRALRAAAPPIAKGKRRSVQGALCALVTLAALAASALATWALSAAAWRNYPGGVALAQLHRAEGPAAAGLSVHVENLPAMTGASRFGEEGRARGWTYDKTEGLEVGDYHPRGYDRLVTGHREVPGYRCAFAVDQFSGYDLPSKADVLEGRLWPPLALRTAPAVFVHERLANATEVRGCADH